MAFPGMGPFLGAAEAGLNEAQANKIASAIVPKPFIVPVSCAVGGFLFVLQRLALRHPFLRTPTSDPARQLPKAPKIGR
jgi:hypothetical protein